MQATTTILYQTLLLTFGLLVAFSLSLNAQDSLRLKYLKTIPTKLDSLLIKEDSQYYCSLIARKGDSINKIFDNYRIAPKKRKILELPDNNLPLISGGFVSYATNYRSFIDTPFLEKNILQHNLSGQISGNFLGLPLIATYYIRHSNSSFFNNIYDIQVSLDRASIANRINRELQNRINKHTYLLDDSSLRKLISVKQLKLNLIKEWLRSSFQKQRIVEAQEILGVPKITFHPEYTLEENKRREDSLKTKAAKFLSLHATVDSIYKGYMVQLDSIKNIYENNLQKITLLKSLSSNGIGSYRGYLDYKKEISKLNIDEEELPSNYKHLMAIRNLSVGRSSLNYSDLTAKNIGINGINAEYNSWYYAAFSAGLVDFRFRDFTINPVRSKQYLVLGRIGLGRIENNYIILSGFAGQKQLFASNANGAGTRAINIKGYGVEAKYSISQNIYLTGEVAESISPDFRSSRPINTKPGSRDYSNNAFALKFVSLYPSINARIEGFYKYTGSNYQSFSSFQTNSELKTWYAKVDKYLFNRVFKFSAALRSNDFSNPYVIQNYKSNTIFKTASFVFRKRRWPVISGGYMPMSQFTIVDNITTENRFQSVNANVYHLYNIGSTRTATTAMYNKFINSGSDSGFIYFNASNIYFSQNIFLGKTIASLGISDTRNSDYQYQVFDESLQMSFGRISTLTTGIKINNFNRQDVKVGGYIVSGIRVFKNDIINLSLERGYLPGLGRKLTRNDMATVQFIKTFGYVNN